MSFRLGLRILLASLLGALLLVTIGAALQFREIAVLTEDVLGRDAHVLEVAAEMQRLLGEESRGTAFRANFRDQIDQLGDAETTPEARAAATEVADTFEAYLAARDATNTALQEQQESRLRELVAGLHAVLQFRDLPHGAPAPPSPQLDDAVAELRHLLDEPSRGRRFEQSFRWQVARIEQARVTDQERAIASRLRRTFDSYVTAGHDLTAAAEAADTAVRDAVANLSAVAGEQATKASENIRAEAVTAALGLAFLGATMLVFGIWVSRTVRVNLFDRLATIDRFATAIQRGDTPRRLVVARDDELAHVSAAINLVLDQRDRDEAAMRGRNRELRALVVALLRQLDWPAAVTGIDGEIIASTLDPSQEETLRSIAPQVRASARTLLSRRFLTAAELATDIRVGGHHIRIQGLALGGQRIVGWLARIVS